MNVPVLISTTFERQDDAEKIAKILLNKRLVACAQVHGPVKSMYHWKDDITASVEFILTLKSFESLYEHIEILLLTEHPYDVPEILAQPIVRISPGYLTWMQEEIGE